MAEEFKRKLAAEYLNIPDSLLKNLSLNSKEIPYYKRGSRYFYLKNELDNWLELQENRKIELDLFDYKRCLEFAFKIIYSGHTTSDFGTARQRGTLQAISNWTQGALAEITIQKFLQKKFNIKIQLDFDVHGVIVGQDITQVERNRVLNPPRIRVSIKSGKMNSCFLIVAKNEVEIDQRTSDYYVLVRIDFPEDHLLRALRDHPILENIQHYIPTLDKINAVIAGYTKKENLEMVDEIPGIEFNDKRYVKNVGGLLNSDDDWKTFSSLL